MDSAWSRSKLAMATIVSTFPGNPPTNLSAPARAAEPDQSERRENKDASATIATRPRPCIQRPILPQACSILALF